MLPRHTGTLHDQPFPSRRSAVLGLGPMVTTSQPLAAQAGLEVLRAGGNACDAAVATAAMLAVVEPTGTGMGGDAFALVYLAGTRTVRALNGSGRAPAALSPGLLASRGLDHVPERGALSITVPGAVDAWATLVATHGRLTLAACLAPAMATAERGFPVSELIARAWAASEPLLAAHPDARGHFMPRGRTPRPGDVVRLPALAGSLRRVAEGGAEAFYRGPIAVAIVDAVQSAGGCLDTADLARHTSEWVEPIAVRFADLDVWQCPPNSQGLAAQIALGVADGLALGAERWGSAEALHLLVEATRIGLRDARAVVADPAVSGTAPAALLSPDHLARRRSAVDVRRAAARVGRDTPTTGDTVYLAVVDADGNACSFINSNYMGFGSGIVAGSTGIPLQNRGAGFVSEPGHPNHLVPGRRPFHTLMPGLTTRSRDGSLHACFGVMGGDMQPQGHVQVLANLVRFGMDPQRALDAPRFYVTRDDRLALEPWHADDVRATLTRFGHSLVPRDATPPAAVFGGGQVIAVSPDGVRIGGSDPRKDGQVVAF